MIFFSVEYFDVDNASLFRYLHFCKKKNFVRFKILYKYELPNMNFQDSFQPFSNGCGFCVQQNEHIQHF